MKLNVFEVEKIMAENGLTRKEVAQKCRMSRQSVSTIIRRGTCLPVTAGKLAAGLGVDVIDILEQEDT